MSFRSEQRHKFLNVSRAALRLLTYLFDSRAAGTERRKTSIMEKKRFLFLGNRDSGDHLQRTCGIDGRLGLLEDREPQDLVEEALVDSSPDRGVKSLRYCLTLTDIYSVVAGVLVTGHLEAFAWLFTRRSWFDSNGHLYYYHYNVSGWCGVWQHYIKIVTRVEWLEPAYYGPKVGHVACRHCLHW